MSKEKPILLPKLKRSLAAVGENIRLARLRRQLSAARLSERANISRATLHRIEHGDPSVSMGSYCNVLLCLNLEADLELLAKDDVLGQKLQDAKLTTRARAPKTKLEEHERRTKN